MKRIKEYTDEIKEELCGAKGYAENYLYYKSTNPSWSKMYLTMAQQELQHAEYLHTMVTQEIEKLKEVIDPPENMMEKWKHEHNEYVDKTAWIKQMLSL